MGKTYKVYKRKYGNGAVSYTIKDGKTLRYEMFEGSPVQYSTREEAKGQANRASFKETLEDNISFKERVVNFLTRNIGQ